MTICLFRMEARGIRGFTLIELLLGIAIGGIIGAGVITALYQLVTYNSLYSNRLVALREVEGAIDIISRDVWQAESVTVNGTDYFIQIKYGAHKITYTADTVGRTLKRELDGNDAVVIARNIDTDNTSVSLSGESLILKVTSRVTGLRTVSVTREVQVRRRTV